jgi:hypothetical protein
MGFNSGFKGLTKLHFVGSYYATLLQGTAKKKNIKILDDFVVFRVGCINVTNRIEMMALYILSLQVSERTEQVHRI